MKILLGMALGFALAFGMFGDHARYGREVYQLILNCEEQHVTECNIDVLPTGKQIPIKPPEDRAT